MVVNRSVFIESCKTLVLAAMAASFMVSCGDKNTDGSTLQKTAYNIYLPVGASAKDLLSDKTYKQLVVEIDYMPGCKPDTQAITHLKTFLESNCHKPAGVSVIVSPIAGVGKKPMGVQQAAQVEEINRNIFPNGQVLSVYVLIVNSIFSDDKTLSQSYYNTSICLFGETIRKNADGPGQPGRAVVEANAMEHEFGHLLGLVNRGSPMVDAHRDEEHGYHCSNPECLMYFNGETTDILGYLSTGGVPDLDSSCSKDLKANGGK